MTRTVIAAACALLAARTVNAQPYLDYHWGTAGYNWVGDFGCDTKADWVAGRGGLVFLYQPDPIGTAFRGADLPIAGNWGSPAYTRIGDFNGDKKADIATLRDRHIYTYLSKAPSSPVPCAADTSFGFTSHTTAVPTDWGNPGFTWAADFNGDGKTDIASAVGSTVAMYISTGDGFRNETWQAASVFGQPGFTWVADFDGNGKADIASAIGGNVYMSLSQGTSFKVETWSVAANWGSPEFTWVGDFDGDGKPDLASARNADLYVKLSRGSRFDSYTWTTGGRFGEPGYTWVGDFDGNKMTDIASARGFDVYMNLSTGTGIKSATWPVGAGWGDPAYTKVGDFDGNGLTDIASANDRVLRMFLSRGSSFITEQWSVTAARRPSFTLALVGDAQFDWGCSSEGEMPNFGYCAVDANRRKPLAVQAQETNQNVIDRVSEVGRKSNGFSGLIVNGDLTAFGDQDDALLGKFTGAYFGREFMVWPGLGNHDYENPVNDCGFGVTRNYCAAAMMQFLAGSVMALRDSTYALGNFDVSTYSKNPGQAGSQRNVAGSLAYSWDIGDFHFVQLNNYPTYTTHFTRGFGSGISSWDLDARSPLTWLQADLAKAVAANKKVILNWHDFQDVYTKPDDPDYKTLVSWLDPYAGSIKAIFVGHIHKNIGCSQVLKFPPTSVHPAIEVPVVSSGSPIWSRFVKAEFASDGQACTIQGERVNTDKPYGGGVPGSLFTIDCAAAHPKCVVPPPAAGTGE